MAIRPWTWWLIFGVLWVGGVGLYALLAVQGYPAAGRWAFIVCDVLATAWVVYGLIHWRSSPTVRRVALFLGFTVVMQLLAGFFWLWGSLGGMIATVGVWAMVVAFFGGLALVRMALAPGHPILGVARTLVDEAIRMRAPLVFIVALLLVIPVLPFALDPQVRLEYRLQTFLTWSLTAVSVLLSLMTIFLAVGTVTRELQYKQIFLTMTKPVSRLEYLLGKWVGIAALNLLLVIICGAGIYAFTRLLERTPDQGITDRLAVERQVLIGRESQQPSPPASANLPELLQQRLIYLQQQEPTVYGAPGTPAEELPANLREQIQREVLTQWFAVGPRSSKGFLFTGLERAQAMAGEQGTVQLRIRPQPASPTPDAQVRLMLRVNGQMDPNNPWVLAEGQYHVIDVPAALIDPQGRLEVEIGNPVLMDPNDPTQGRAQPTISFNIADGVELLYPVSGFESNFARGLGVLWVRLVFLAMLGIAAGTYLSFPVASLLAVMIYIASVGSGYLLESLEGYAAIPGGEAGLWDQTMGVFSGVASHLSQGAIADAGRIVIRLMGSLFLMLVPALGDYDPITLVADGRDVPARMVGGAFFWVGLVWTGLAGFIGWLIFRNRELARVTV